jgi:thioredoxin reductase
VNVLFNSKPLEFTQTSVVLDVDGMRQEIENDFVWIFAGGTPPNDFLKKIGVGFGARDLSLDASQEVKHTADSGKQLAEAAATAY